MGHVSAPSTLLDFPTRQRFVEEITAHHYDVIGISGIVVNVAKVREMCRLARERSPTSRIVVPPNFVERRNWPESPAAGAGTVPSFRGTRGSRP